MAVAALAAPVTFAVLIYYLPQEYTNAIAHLSRHVSPEVIEKVQYISRDYAARIDADGDAVFTNVLPGKYNFSFDYPPGSQYEFNYWWGLNPVDLYSANVKPLCGGVQSFSY